MHFCNLIDTHTVGQDDVKVVQFIFHTWRYKKKANFMRGGSVNRDRAGCVHVLA